MKIKLFLSVVCTFLFYSINGGIIDEKEICEKLSTDLLKLKEFIAESKAEYDKNTNTTSVFQGIKRFRLKDSGNFRTRDGNHGSLLKSLFNVTLYAVNQQNYVQELSIIDNEKRKYLKNDSVTRCISPSIVYDLWSIRADSFSSWKDDIEHTVIENKTYSTSYSVTDETLTEWFRTMSPFKVNVSALSKVKVTTAIYSYDSTWLYSVGGVLKIRSEDFETSVEQSDDAVKAAALEFFGSKYWKNLNKENDKEWQPRIETFLSGDLVLSEFPIVNKNTMIDGEIDIGKDEPL